MTTPEVYDAIVVGAGPGGAAAAYFLGCAGRRVLVLEKENLPRYKACGGGLAAEMLERNFPFSFEPVIETHVQAFAFCHRGRTHTIPLPERRLRTVMRDRLDAHILAHAPGEVRTGVAVRRVAEAEDRVTVETAGGETFEARWLVGADGANSVVARALGLRRGKITVAAVEAEVPAPPEVHRRLGSALLFITGDVRMGYAWIFPKAAHLSVGIAAYRPRPGELQSALKRVAARYGLSLDGAPLKGHPIPIYVRREPIATCRSLLVGDAAGLADPFSGEGIRLAIKSGRLAAEAILAGRLDRYPSLIHRRIGLSHTLGLGVSLLFYRFPGAFFRLAAPMPYVSHALADMLADRANYAEVLLRILAGLPLYWMGRGLAALAGFDGGGRSA